MVVLKQNQVDGADPRIILNVQPIHRTGALIYEGIIHFAYPELTWHSKKKNFHTHLLNLYYRSLARVDFGFDFNCLRNGKTTRSESNQGIWMEQVRMCNHVAYK